MYMQVYPTNLHHVRHSSPQFLVHVELLYIEQELALVGSAWGGRG